MGYHQSSVKTGTFVVQTSRHSFEARKGVALKYFSEDEGRTCSLDLGELT